MPARVSDARAHRATAYESDRPDIRALVPPQARRILDLGCASGVVGAALKRDREAQVVGIERDPAYADDAERALDRVVRADLEELAGHDDLPEELGRFDCLVAGDVLEHLRDPWRVLRAMAALLDPGGHAVVSLPNVRFWETFWQLGWRGSWPRRSQGVFDRDHLRWFTARDGHALLDDAGLDVIAVDRQYRWRPTPSARDRRAALLGRTPLRPFFVFQHVFLGRRRGS